LSFLQINGDQVRTKFNVRCRKNYNLSSVSYQLFVKQLNVVCSLLTGMTDDKMM
jgi:hypothetical protein